MDDLARLQRVVEAGEKIDERLLKAVNSPAKLHSSNQDEEESKTMSIPTMPTTTPTTTPTPTPTTTVTTLPSSLTKPKNQEIRRQTNDFVFIGNTQNERESIDKYYIFKANFPILNPGITRFYNLTSLRIIKSKLTELPDDIGALSEFGKLVELSLDFNELEEIPDSIAQITSLQRLTLSHNKLSHLPFNLGRLDNIQHLNVAHNQLKDVPESTRNMTGLTELFLQSNEINVLPSHGDPSGPGKCPSGSGPTAMSVIEAAAKVRASERAAEEFREKILKSESPREIMYWLGRIKDEIMRGAIDGLDLAWLDEIAALLGRHRKEPTKLQVDAKQRILNNKEMLKMAKGMNASELKKELKKRELDSSYSGSRRELVQRLEKFCVDDNKNNVVIIRGDWITEVELKYLDIVSLVSPHNVITLKFWIWCAKELRNADGKYSMSDPYTRVIFQAPNALDREMFRSSTIRNTLDPNWCETHSVDIDQRINLSECTMRFEVWDWDYGGDDVDDLLGQLTFQGESVVAAAVEAAAAKVAAAGGETPEAAAMASSSVSYYHGGKIKRDKEEEEKTQTTLQELLEEGRNGKTNNDLIHDLEEAQKKEDQDRVESMTGSGASVTHVVYGNAKYNVPDTSDEKKEEVETNTYKEGPSFLQHRKLRPMTKESVAHVPGEKKIKKVKTINVKGTMAVAVRVEPSSASRAAMRMEQEEKEASASAFELWPELFVADLSHNRIMQLPRGVRGWKKLRRLHLGGNTLSVLPDEFCHCSNLENLNMADNQLVTLPANFGHLSKLMNLRLDRNKLEHVPESTYTITTLRQLHLADNPLKPIDGVKLWHHGDPILRFKNTAQQLLEVEPTKVRRMEPGTRIFDTTLYTRKIRTDGGPDERGQGPQADHVRFDSILCADFFSVTGCRYGAYCMFSHIPEPLPVVPFQRTKEKMSKEDVRMGVTSHNKKPVNFYGITHSEYDELWEMLEEDDADDESDSDSSDDEEEEEE